jgi:hypothetical protein
MFLSFQSEDLPFFHLSIIVGAIFGHLRRIVDMIWDKFPLFSSVSFSSRHSNCETNIF